MGTLVAPAMAATTQQEAARRNTPLWVWLLLLLVVVLLVWWLWDSLRQKAADRQSVAAQPTVPESLGDAIAQAEASGGRVGTVPAAASTAQPQVSPAVIEPSVAAPAPSAAVTDVPMSETTPILPKRSTAAEKNDDDLTVIEGIGPKISAVLQQAGIDSYAALAATPVDDLRKVLADNQLRFVDPSTWPEQAVLAGTDPDKLAELQASLKGGRRR